MLDLDDPRVAIYHNPHITYKKADVESAIIEVFKSLKLDKEHTLTKNWNPLGDLISEGDTVLLKPNWVTHFNPNGSNNLEELITHPTVIDVILEYVERALNGRGKITLADAPIQSCSIKDIYAKCGIKPILELHQDLNPNLEYQLIDLRKTVINAKGRTSLRVEDQSGLSGDPAGYSLIDLGQKSLLKDIDYQWQNFRVTNYNYHLLQENHNHTNHKYLVSNSILNANVIINLPKLKCHMKAGLTAAMKNLIGINGHKEYLPHHCNGSAAEGGDQYIYKSTLKRIYNKIYDSYWSNSNGKPSTWLLLKLNFVTAVTLLFAKDPLLDGAWLGNQTVARTTIDLNNILYFYNEKLQKMQGTPARKVFHLVDGIIAGEGNGPLRPTAKHAGILSAGFNSLLIDTALAQIMGYHPFAINTIRFGHTHILSRLLPNEANLISPILNGEETPLSLLPNLHFVKPKFWRHASNTTPNAD